MSEKGILLAVSSLPGKYGCGDFSSEAYEFIDILKNNNLDIWQILPLNPIGYGHSPYQPFSSYAFDEIYISLEDLKERGLVSKFEEIEQKDNSNFEQTRSIKEKAIYEAYINFSKSKENNLKVKEFLEKYPFVDEYCEFITVKEFNNNVSWDNWNIKKEDRPEEFLFNKNKHAFAQYILFEEWAKIRKYANKKGIKIVGDLPFYVGYDSSDVYYHRESYYLDKEDKPTCIAGVPPDYFSEDGQRWGNPIYNWEYLEKTNFKTLVDRISFASLFYDVVRIDHFRAFDSYWAIVPTCPTARDGEWRFPNGKGFFKQLFKEYPNINIIVEDLGNLRPEVLELRDYFNLSGMRELEFTIFEDELQDKHVEMPNQIYYVSTHDNETLNEWISNQKPEDIKNLEKRVDNLGFTGDNLCEKLVKYALNRKERMIIMSVTDILNLDKKYRMNKPGIIDEINWTFKLKSFKNLKQVLKKVLM